MGIKGDKVINEEDTERNISNMFSGVKSFYKNNLNGTKEQFDLFLQDKFSITESIDKLSYNDFKSLQKALDIARKAPTGTMNSALESLKKDGASSILSDAFEKVVSQNKISGDRVGAYNDLDAEFKVKLGLLSKERLAYEAMLKELKKRRQEMIEEYNRAMAKLQHEVYKSRKFNMLNGLNALNIPTKGNSDKYDPLENLTKQHDRQLQNLDKQKLEVEIKITEIGKEIMKVSGEYSKFMIDPSPFIDNYLSNKHEE
jgi:hypothetical protein